MFTRFTESPFDKMKTSTDSKSRATAVAFISGKDMCVPRSIGSKRRPVSGSCSLVSARSAPVCIEKLRYVAPPGPDKADTTIQMVRRRNHSTKACNTIPISTEANYWF